MTENVVAAIIALFGVFLSVVASVLVSIRQSRIESQKLRSEYLHLYAAKLFDKRMTAYTQILEPVVFIIQNGLIDPFQEVYKFPREFLILSF